MKRLLELSTIFFILIFSVNFSIAAENNLWALYQSIFKNCEYVDLTHAFSPTIIVWPGFGNAKFKPAIAGAEMPGYINEGQEFTYEKHGFIATAYEIHTDQYGTQLDPPAHWDEYGATISDLPATYAISPPDWKHGVSVLESPGAPLPKQPYPLKRAQNGVLKPTKP